ncbi:glycosyltransferase family 39 protein [Maridesulfovibrio ferrireducens]|uniref:ArnT family glycosyltransferase n=1 Tax=Maridesulfovibrio ferrireducens TaxID=246191 RepID=UPI001A3433DE|nr:glycosyltransferase family 39 protein [Maridesulfovibrio ferrireducens]MBI9110430.1 glycosyltransferase family 39 protein [Maridesulfovibrio ferrireducens]
MSDNSSRNRVIVILLSLSILLFVSVVWFAVDSSLAKTENSYLTAHSKGKWIRLDVPFRLNARNNGSEMTLFRTSFDLSESKSATLHFKAFRSAGVWLDGNPLLKSDGDLSNWREEVSLDLPQLSSGAHQLKIAVVNENAHPVLLAWSDELGLSTGEGWEASKDNYVWNLALDAGKSGSVFISNKFKRGDKALLQSFPYMLVLFLFTAVLVWMRDHKKLLPQLNQASISPELFRFVLIFFWVVMALNNFHKLPLKLGMDSTGHYTYIQYIADNLRLPSPVEGWQMFQPPLYYIISAAAYKVLSALMGIESALYWLRLIPLACGAAMIEICYRSAKLVFGKNKTLQIIATLLGGFMPMNFVMSQFWSNEPLAAVFSGLIILMVLTLIIKQESRNLKSYAYLGLFMGLAILSKATACLLIPLSVFFILFAILSSRKNSSASPLSSFVGIGLSAAITAVVGGWYYFYNWYAYGKPFIGGWDAMREIVWWQDHGYRIWEHFVTFGSSLLRPVYSTTNGIWDGLYATLWLDGNLSGVSKFASRPPWNDDLMVASALLALIPSIWILIGISRTFFTPVKSVLNGRMFLVGCLVVYFTAVTYLYLNLPIYSTAKASYTLGLLSCFGILATVGVEPFLKNKIMKAVTCGFLAVWASTVYITYFV